MTNQLTTAERIKYIESVGEDSMTVEIAESLGYDYSSATPEECKPYQIFLTILDNEEIALTEN